MSPTRRARASVLAGPGRVGGGGQVRGAGLLLERRMLAHSRTAVEIGVSPPGETVTLDLRTGTTIRTMAVLEGAG